MCPSALGFEFDSIVCEREREWLHRSGMTLFSEKEREKDIVPSKMLSTNHCIKREEGEKSGGRSIEIHGKQSSKPFCR